MCGIAGIVSPGTRVDPVTCGLERALDRIAHRGPDDRGVWTNGADVALGHRRLTILDLSDRGHQPAVSADGRYAMVFNGEVYNFAAIRDELEATGRTFDGTGDTPVLFAALQHWGTAALERFIGMFAIALWDERDRTLLLVRDRVGIKPLYYGWDGTTLCFGSEMKALRAFSHWTPELNMRAAGEYFQYGYIAGPRTIFEHAYKLEPGCLLRLTEGGAPEVRRYWSIPAGAPGADAMTAGSGGVGAPGADAMMAGSGGAGAPGAGDDDGEREEQLEALLRDACRYRMVSDVPVGVYLSGGIDSSTVTALLAHNGGQHGPLRTFTIGFEENRHDESPFARRVAEHLGTVHTEYILRVDEALEMARGWGELFDEPFADSSGLPTLLVSRLAAREVKVVLSADGGDELFGGYSVYDDALRKWQRLSRVPRAALAALGAMVGGVPIGGLEALLRGVHVPASRRGPWLRQMRRLRDVLHNPTPAGVFDGAITYWLPDNIRQLLGAYACPRPSSATYAGEAAEQMCLWDAHHYLPEDILTKVDRTTMAASIEGREPLLDHRVVEFAFQLPLHLRRGALGPKHLLKKILYRHVPREFVDRPKQGFRIPLEEWLRGDLRQLVCRYLDPECIRRDGLFHPRVVRRVVEDFFAGNSRETARLWYLLAFEMWRERWG